MTIFQFIKFIGFLSVCQIGSGQNYTTVESTTFTPTPISVTESVTEKYLDSTTEESSTLVFTNTTELLQNTTEYDYYTQVQNYTLDYMSMNQTTSGTNIQDPRIVAAIVCGVILGLFVLLAIIGGIIKKCNSKKTDQTIQTV